VEIGLLVLVICLIKVIVSFVKRGEKQNEREDSKLDNQKH
jgi:hypothetical protein